jgi:hypothetical protein
MSLHNWPENLINPEQDQENKPKSDHLRHPETSRASEDLASRLEQDVFSLKWAIDGDPTVSDRVSKSAEWSRLYGDLTLESSALWKMINDPKNRNADGKLTKDALLQIETQYNKIQKIMQALNGIVHGSIGSANQEQSRQMEAKTEKGRQETLDFQTAMKQWRENQASNNAEKAQVISQNPAWMSGKGYPPEWERIEKKTDADLSLA